MRKLLNKRGSVLFLVVIVMALLLIAASATYYVIRNQHASANTHYSSEQSYQTALSVSENVSKYIDGVVHKIQTGQMTFDSTNIVGRMVALAENGTPLSATPTDLTADGLGEFNVEIVKVAENGDSHTFDIITTAEVNGETVRLVMRKIIVLSAAETKYFTRFLTSTGRGTAEDTFLAAGDIFGTSYFENSYTQFTQGNTKIRESVYATGTLEDYGVVYNQIDPNEYTEMIVGGNFNLLNANGDAVGVKCVYVGGDMTAKKAVAAKEVFVMGDLTVIQDQNAPGASTVFHVGGDCYILGGSTANNTIYVDGDLYLGDDEKSWYGVGTFYVKGSVYIRNTNGGINGYISYGDTFEKTFTRNDGTVVTKNEDNIENLYGKNKDKAGNTIDVAQKILSSFTDSVTGYSYANNNELDSWDDIENYIYNSVAMGTYSQWNAETYFEKTFTTAFENDPIRLGYDGILGDNVNVIQPGTTDQIGTIKQSGSAYIFTINKSCKLAPIKTYENANVLLLDATESELYIYLDHDGYVFENWNTRLEDCFTFFTSSGNSVLVKGTHPVVFVLPDGTNYKHSTQLFVSHLDLAAYLLGRSKNDPDGYRTPDKFVGVYTSDFAVSNGDEDATFKPIFTDIEYDSEDGTRLTVLNKDAVDPSNGQRLFAADTTLHNNIFLVTIGDDRNVLDFNTLSSFCGYVYAPNMTLRCDGSYGGLQFFGGLIVGGYTYNNPSAILVFAAPYDPYKPGHENTIVTDLMSENNKYSNNSNPAPSESSSGGVVIQSHNIGYK